MDPSIPKSCCSSSFSSSHCPDALVSPASGEACHSLSHSASSAIVSDPAGLPDGHGLGVHPESFPSDSSSQTGYALKEQDYIGMAEVCSAKSGDECMDDDAKVLNTDLHLGLAPHTTKAHINQPKAQAPLELGLKLDSEERIHAMPPNAHMVFMNVFAPSRTTPKNGVKRSYLNISLREISSDAKVAHSTSVNNAMPLPTSQPTDLTEHPQNRFLSKWSLPKNPESDELDPPPAKERVVGWPPIRSYRKNSLFTTNPTRGVNDSEGQSNIYVKVNMDGIPIGRKVDLNAYNSYKSLSIALEEMFYSPNSGHSIHFLSDSEFVLTYEDKEGDWMLVGDVPWGMFVEAVKRLRIVRPSEAVGAAPRAPKMPV